jgi:hypothetical protein
MAEIPEYIIYDCSTIIFDREAPKEVLDHCSQINRPKVYSELDNHRL